MAVEGVFRVRRAEPAAYVAAAAVLLRSCLALVPAIPPLAHLDEEVMKHFVGTVVPVAEVWAVEIDGAVSVRWFWRETGSRSCTSTQTGPIMDLAQRLSNRRKSNTRRSLNPGRLKATEAQNSSVNGMAFRPSEEPTATTKRDPDIRYRWVKRASDVVIQRRLGWSTPRITQ